MKETVIEANVIEASGLSKRYGTATAVDNVDF